ncbi:MAG: M18 family aminopeptidase [Deltaproteobacteria bacterium]|nr:M18 family aminopeptidase [Deltaproteobacteria bacterium]
MLRGMPSEAVADLLDFIARSPTPYHAVAETVQRLESAGFRECRETDLWQLASGDRRYAVRNEGSLVAFELGEAPPAEAGFRIVGAHSDSPNLRLKPRPDVEAHGYRQYGVEPYGGALLHTWLDRDLSLAGRVSLQDGEKTRIVLLDFGRPLLRVPNLAVHLQRELRSEGLKLNAQTQLVPIAGLEDAPLLAELVAGELRDQQIADVAPEEVLAFDLMTYDTQPPAVAGVRGEFVQASRIDDLASCHAALSALLAAAGSPAAFTRALVIYDHEEVGSRTAEGAAGPLLLGALERVVAGFEGGEPQGLARALARSVLISADMAHAVHPNYADKHEPGHRPVIGRGPVLKLNANQSYASDARTSGLFAALCRRVGIEPQHFVSRSDVGCGSTIGPITAARVGIPTVDVGNPMLSMHSCREMAGTADVKPMIDVLGVFYAG